MASNALLAHSGATVVSNKGFTGVLPVGLGPPSALSTTSSKRASLRPLGLVVKAQQGGGAIVDPMDPRAGELFHKKVALIDTSPYGDYSTSLFHLLFCSLAH